MFPIAVKGHMPFGPNYNGEAVTVNKNSKRAKNITGKFDVSSCPVIQAEKKTYRVRSKSTNYIDPKLSTSKSNSDNTSRFREKLKQWFNLKSTVTKPCKSCSPLSGEETPNGDNTDCENKTLTVSSLNRSYSMNTPQHLPRLDAIQEEDEAITSKQASDTLLLSKNKRNRPASLHVDRRVQNEHPQTYQQMFQWSDSESSCESIKDAVSRA